MSGIFDSLRAGARTLSSLETALAVVSDNVANVNTPGYTRRRAVFESSQLGSFAFGVLGTGVEVDRISATRNSLIENRILGELQKRGNLTGQRFPLEQIETILFGTAGSGVSEQMSRFFDSFSELVSNPASLEFRQAVLAEGQRTADVIRNTSVAIASLEVNNRAEARNSVTHTNSLLKQLARIDSDVTSLQRQGLDAGPLKDQQEQLLRQLAEEIDFHYYQTDQGLHITTVGTGRLLLNGATVHELELGETAAGLTVSVDGVDISSSIDEGRLGATLELQSQVFPSFRGELNTLAATLAEKVNTLHQSGEGLDDISGRDFFTVVARSEAATLAVNSALEASQVAAGALSSGPGDGTVAQQITDLRDIRLTELGDRTFNEFFSELVFDAGLAAREVQEDMSSQDRILSELENQCDSFSGVSLDEEAVNLIQYQRSFQATARVMRTLDELLEETMNLIR